MIIKEELIPLRWSTYPSLGHASWHLLETRVELLLLLLLDLWGLHLVLLEVLVHLLIRGWGEVGSIPPMRLIIPNKLTRTLLLLLHLESPRLGKPDLGPGPRDLELLLLDEARVDEAVELLWGRLVGGELELRGGEAGVGGGELLVSIAAAVIIVH